MSVVIFYLVIKNLPSLWFANDKVIDWRISICEVSEGVVAIRQL